MPFNGSGVFSIVNTFVPGTTIFSSAVNTNFSDIATGLSTTVLKNGTQTITASIPMSGFGFTNVGVFSTSGLIFPLPQGRLTGTTAVPVTTSDVTAAATVYWSPYLGGTYPVFGSAVWSFRTTAELSLALDSNAVHTGYQQSGKNFDFFLMNDSGTDRLVTGPAWSTDTTRGIGAGTTELTRRNGILVNANSMTVKFDTSASTKTVAANEGTYVGSMRMTANGQTEDSATKRFLWNMYNRTARKLFRKDTTDTWNYSTASFQQANASSANQVEIINGIDEDSVLLYLVGRAVNSTATVRNVFIAIGLDSTTAKAADSTASRGQITNSVFFSMPAAYSGFPGLGYHFLTWLEQGAGADTQTWAGDVGGTQEQTGLTGWCRA